MDDSIERKTVTKSDIQEAVSASLIEVLESIEEREKKQTLRQKINTFAQIVQVILIPVLGYLLLQTVQIQKDVVQLRAEIHEHNRALENDKLEKVAYHAQISKIHHTPALTRECTKCHNLNYEVIRKQTLGRDEE